MSELQLPAGLPEDVDAGLRRFVQQVHETLNSALLSMVLFGSAAEGRMRSTSDVNIILVLKMLSTSGGASIQGPLAMAKASIQLKAMILLESEIGSAMECFAQKFADILRRHYVILGPDPFAGRQVPRQALMLRTRQVLLNLALRLRERSILSSAQPDLTLRWISEIAGPLRTCAATIVELETGSATTPREAFRRLVREMAIPEWNYLPDYVSALRDGQPKPEPPPLVATEHLIALASSLQMRVERL